MTHIEWQFGGWLHTWPAGVAAGVLLTIAAAGLGGIAWSYQHARGTLASRARWSLAALRAALLALVLLCLANPVRVEKSALPEKSPRTLAVLVDRSASMSTPDYRGETRLASALRRWRQAEPPAKASFATVHYWRFAGDVQPANSLDEAANTGTPGNETHLFAALRKVSAENPAAIVCLTDGLDTSADDPAKFTAEATERGVPIYFVPGENRLLPGASLMLREIDAPSRVLRKTQFTATALIECTAAHDQQLPVELWVNGRKYAATKLPARAGRNTLSWPATVDSGEAGALSLEFRAGDQAGSCVTEVAESRTVEVLYYQGALQWGYRFLRGALESDPSFRLTSILNPALHVQLTASSANTLAPADLPEDPAELRRYQVVVLAHVFAAQLSARQQQALVDYVRGGGSVLFISPDTTATEQFSGTALEQVLPVVFESPGTAETPVQQMQQQLSANAAQAGDDFFAGGNQGITLKPFALPPGAPSSAAGDLFAGTNGEPLPKFASDAKVHALKPGAEILAVSSRDPEEVLLARQRFGHGYAAALTTDLLWRWKMSLPSGSHAVEKFWQQLLLSLAPQTSDGLRMTRLTPSPAANAPVLFSIDNADRADSPRLEAVSPAGVHEPLTVSEAQDGENSSLQARFTPDKTGRWELRASTASGRAVSLTFPVAEKSSSAELSNLPADLEGLRQLAESTGGALVEASTVLETPVESAAKAPEKLPQPLWNSAPICLALLGLYAVELTLRRRWKLL